VEHRLIKILARKGFCFVGAMREQPKAETVTVVAHGEVATSPGRTMTANLEAHVALRRRRPIRGSRSVAMRSRLIFRR
jgi:hypothetical protein